MPASEENRHSKKKKLSFQSFFQQEYNFLRKSLLRYQAGFLARRSSHFPFLLIQNAVQWIVKEMLPDYSDRIAQDLHLIPFSVRIFDLIDKIMIQCRHVIWYFILIYHIAVNENSRQHFISFITYGIVQTYYSIWRLQRQL